MIASNLLCSRIGDTFILTSTLYFPSPAFFVVARFVVVCPSVFSSVIIIKSLLQPDRWMVLIHTVCVGWQQMAWDDELQSVVSEALNPWIPVTPLHEIIAAYSKPYYDRVSTLLDGAPKQYGARWFRPLGAVCTGVYGADGSSDLIFIDSVMKQLCLLLVSNGAVQTIVSGMSEEFAPRALCIDPLAPDALFISGAATIWYCDADRRLSKVVSSSGNGSGSGSGSGVSGADGFFELHGIACRVERSAAALNSTAIAVTTPATATDKTAPTTTADSSDRSLFVADYGAHKIWRLDLTSAPTSPPTATATMSGAARCSAVQIRSLLLTGLQSLPVQPRSVCLARSRDGTSDGALYFTTRHSLCQLDIKTERATLLPIESFSLTDPAGVGVTRGGTVIVSDSKSHSIFAVDPITGRMDVRLAGQGLSTDRRGYADGDAKLSKFDTPHSVVIDNHTACAYIIEATRIRRLTLPFAYFRE